MLENELLASKALSGAPSIPPELAARHDEEFRRLMSYEEFIDLVASLFEKYYTDAEIEQLFTFYRSPLGQKTIRITPEVMKDLNGRMHALLDARLLLIMERLRRSTEKAAEEPASPRPAEAGTATVMGSIPKDLVRKVIENHRDQIRYCYEEQPALNPRLEGKVSIRWVIKADGTASNATIEPSATSLEDSKVHECMLSCIRSWQFPKPALGGIAVTTYPWVFRSAAGPAR